MKLYLYITDPEGVARGNHSFHAMDHKSSIDEQWVLAGEVDVYFDIDRQKLIEQAASIIEEEENELRGSFEHRLQRLEDRRKNLLAIPHLKPVDGAA